MLERGQLAQQNSMELTASVTIVAISVAIAVIIVIINIAAPAAFAAVAHRVCACNCRQLYCRSRELNLVGRRYEQQQQASSSIAMQSSDVHGRAVARNSSYREAPTPRSDATTSGLFLSMAILRGVSPSLQAGG
jgi:hypothetical protein